MKFPRFKKSSARGVVRDWLVDYEPEYEGPYRYEFTYGRHVDTYSYTFIFKRPGIVHREIFMDTNQCSYEEMVQGYKDFIKWAKRTHRMWEKEAKNDVAGQ